MHLDGSLKRYFPLFVCALIAAAAYFQASGMGQLLAATATLDPTSIPVHSVTRRSTPLPSADRDHDTSAQAILDRNPFDSATGPLTGEEVKPEVKTPTVAEIDRDPYDDPLCDT